MKLAIQAVGEATHTSQAYMTTQKLTHTGYNGSSNSQDTFYAGLTGHLIVTYSKEFGAPTEAKFGECYDSGECDMLATLQTPDEIRANAKKNGLSPDMIEMYMAHLERNNRADDSHSVFANAAAALGATYFLDGYFGDVFVIAE